MPTTQIAIGTPTPPFVRSPSNLRDHPALVLNADFRPLSYFPLSLWAWQDSVKAVFLERVDIIAEYEQEVRSPSFAMRLPSVIALREYVKPALYPAFTRFNLFLRDEFECQYCGSKGEMTFDHVVPRSKGGKTTWTNVVAACSSCNLRKGNMTVAKSGLRLAHKPFRPTAMQLQNIGRKFPPNYLHESWMDYLYWDAELDE
ncbi:MAG: HNH endonuclease [Rhodobacteraceae bacterium]|nr:HNH endonuclease [Paracoccaceae bacterium]